MANPLYGQNKFDNSIGAKGELVKNGGIPRQDQYGMAPVGGLVQPPYGDYIGYSASTKGAVSLADADPYSESSSQGFPLGTILDWGDRVFKYVQMNGAVTAGKVLQQAAATVVTAHSQMGTTAAVAVTTADEVDISVETASDTDITLNQYQEGYLIVNDGAGQGQSWRIKSHPAHDHSADASIIITCFGKVSTALVGGDDSQLTLTTNPYKDVIVAPTAETGSVVGVTNIDMTDDYYGWIQVRGPKAVLADGTIVLGQKLTRSGGTAGACIVAADNVLMPIAQAMDSTLVTAEYGLIDLKIA